MLTTIELRCDMSANNMVERTGPERPAAHHARSVSEEV